MEGVEERHQFNLSIFQLVAEAGEQIVFAFGAGWQTIPYYELINPVIRVVFTTPADPMLHDPEAPFLSYVSHFRLTFLLV